MPSRSRSTGPPSRSASRSRFDSHVNYIELDPAIDKQLGWLVTRLTYPAQNLWQADGTQISKPPGGATRIWVETRENMPPNDQSHVLPPEMHAYFATPPPLQTPRRGVQAARDVGRRVGVLVLGGAGR